jgi:hypothetical protein
MHTAHAEIVRDGFGWSVTILMEPNGGTRRKSAQIASRRKRQQETLRPADFLLERPRDLAYGTNDTER